LKWIPACAGMTTVAFIVFPIHGNGLTTPMNHFMGQQWFYVLGFTEMIKD